ncbi:MAG: hypothetical protein HY558_01265 [Euryarchaeota archaeon]|nr:hypothetical protein [Euryarchaeota archaeon]
MSDAQGVRVARFLEAVLAPVPLLSLTGLGVLLRSAGGPTFPADLGVFLLLVGVFLGLRLLLGTRWKDENRLYLVAGGLTLLLFAGVTRVVPVGRLLLFGAVSIGLLLALVAAIRPRWKISAHMASATGAAFSLLVADPLLAWTLLVVPPVAWCRLVLRAHTPMQVAAGGILGALVPLAVQRII